MPFKWRLFRRVAIGLVTMANTHQKDELARSIDSGLIVVAFAGASGIATALSKLGLFRWPQTSKHSLQGWPPDYLILLVTSLVLWAVVSGWSDVYRSDRLEDSRQAYWRLGRTLLLWVGTTALALFFLKVQTVSRQFNLLFFCLSSILVLCRSLLERGLIPAELGAAERPAAQLLSDRRVPLSGLLEYSPPALSGMAQ